MPVHEWYISIYHRKGILAIENLQNKMNLKKKQEVSLKKDVWRSDKLVIILKNRNLPMPARDRKWCKVDIEWNVPVTENSNKNCMSRQIQVWLAWGDELVFSFRFLRIKFSEYLIW